MAYNSMIDTMYEYCNEYALSSGPAGGSFLNLILILAIVILSVALFNRYNLFRSVNNERMVKVEKDVEDIKRTIEAVKDKLDEI